MNTWKGLSPSAWGLRTTLASAFFALSAVVLIIYSGVEIFSDINTQEAFISSRQQLIAQDAAKTVSNFINENFSILEAAIWLTNIDTASQKEQRLLVQGLLGLRPAFRRILLLDSENRLLVQASRLSMAASGQLVDRFRDVMPERNPLEQRAMSAVYIEPATSEPLVSMAVPVTDVFGDIKGTLIAELKLKSMFDIVDQLKVGETGYVYVSDRKGNLLAFYDTARVLKSENVSHLKAVADFIQNGVTEMPKKAARYKGIKGTTVVGTYVPLKNPDWAVVTELPWREAYKETIEEVASAVGFTLSAAVLAAIFGFFVARRLSAPMIKLTVAASRIAAGDRDLQAEVSGPTEVAHLAVTFNSMTSQLRQSLKDLELRFADLKRTEEAFRLSEERLRFALEGTTDGIWDWNLKTDQVYFSPRYWTMVGYDPNQFPGSYQSWRQLVHPDDVEHCEKAVLHAIDTHEPFAIEFRFKAKNGEWRWILGRGKVVEDDKEGNAVRVAGSHTDITERKQAEESLRQYERIVSTTQDLVSLISRDYVYEAVNESVLKAHGKKREEIIGRKLDEILGKQVFEERIRERFDQALTGKTLSFKERFEFEALGWRILNIKYYPVYDESGKVEGVVINARDITETTQLEERLIQSQKMEAVGILAGGVAHEVNNPLNGIMNYAQLIVDKSEKENPAVPLANEIISETKRIAEIVRNLLTFARHEQQSHSPAHLPEIFSSVFSLIQTVMRHDQIDLQIDIPENLPAIRCRSQQIQQVFMNLITNARDALNQKYPEYSPEKRLGVFARTITKDGKEFIRTTIEDFGTGIPLYVQERIFEPFFTTKPKETGTGLGLSITYGIVKDHRGELTVESEPGQYTRIHLDLPVDNEWSV